MSGWSLDISKGDMSKTLIGIVSGDIFKGINIC